MFAQSNYDYFGNSYISKRSGDNAKTANLHGVGCHFDKDDTIVNRNDSFKILHCGDRWSIEVITKETVSMYDKAV
eukprot:scaffold3389_cov119-Cylindrotheca_fusiformis.AAC.14